MGKSPFDVGSAQDFFIPAATTLYVSRQNKPRYSGVLCGPGPHWTVTPYSVAFFVGCGGMMDRSGYIYIIKADTGHYKIGRSNNIPRRMSLFAVKLPFDFEIIHSFPCDDMFEAERMLHDSSRKHGYHVRGEWYNLPADYMFMLSEIGRFQGGLYYVDRSSAIYEKDIDLTP